MTMSMTFRVANIIMLIAFLLSVAVQYNDPDPIQWMLVYGAAALACALQLRGKLDWRVPVVIASAAVIWFFIILPGVLSRPFPTTMLDSFHMTSVADEEAREEGGLLIVLGWMAVLGYYQWRKKRTATS